MAKMRDRLYNGLKKRLGDGIILNGSPENRLPNTLSIAIKNIEAHALADAVKDDILISTGSACHSGSTEISQVLKAMNVDLMTARGTVRISTGKNTTEEEVDFAVEAILKAVEKLG
jgi:cysteine desulfurase